MTLQFSVSVRNARLDAFETTTGTSPTLELRTGAPPANCAAADSGSLLATITCPADWMNAAGSGQKTLLGSWTVAASGSGTFGHFRIKGGVTCHCQGTAGTSGTDMILDSATVTSGQTVTVVTFTITDGNA